MKKWAILLLFFVCPAHAAEPDNAGNLLADCSWVKTAPLRGESVTLPPEGSAFRCFGYFGAVQGLISIQFDAKAGAALQVCAPAGVRLTQLIRVYVKYAEDHPGRLHEAPEGLVLDSLWDAFPCPAKP